MKKYKEYFYMLIGVVLSAVSLEYFFFPNEIASGGVSGIALVINAVFGINTSLLVLVLNIVLFILAFLVLGKAFGAKSILVSVAFSGCLWLLETYFPAKNATHNLFLASVFGSVILAFGAAIIFNQGASTGGTSIIAAIIDKFFHIGIGNAILLTDVSVGIGAIWVFGIDKGLFGVFSVILIGTLVDKFIDGFNKCKQVFIVTSKDELVQQYIIKHIDRGCTVLSGQGGYTGSDVKIIYTVVNTRQFVKLRTFIKENNPDAFITVNESAEVLGKGFKDVF